MAKSSAEIAKLLEERQQVARWLERLDMAGDDTADDVRKKVQRDYTARLDQLNAELEGFGSDLRGTLGDLQEKRKELEAKEKALDTRLSESKLRHAVGEYDEAKWNEVHSSIMGQLVKVREDLKESRGEIESLKDILLEIESEPDTDIDDDDDLDLPDIDEDALAREVAKKKAAPPKAKKPVKKSKAGKQRRSSFDELEFLKKAVGSSSKGGPSRKLPDPKAAAARDVPAPTDDLTDAKEAERTLKCGDCGEMNLPTEWYCDNCGAELAVL